MTHIYVLQLKEGKWYIGMTEDVAESYRYHRDGKGPDWTKEYPPVKIKEVLKNVNRSIDITQITRSYMDRYGVKNVRGGVYCDKIIDESTSKQIRQEQWTRSGNCERCGRKGHTDDSCKFTETVDGEPIETMELSFSSSDNSDETVIEEYQLTPVKPQGYYGSTHHTTGCYRCGRWGHYARDCYARTDIEGGKIYN